MTYAAAPNEPATTVAPTTVPPVAGLAGVGGGNAAVERASAAHASTSEAADEVVGMAPGSTATASREARRTRSPTQPSPATMASHRMSNGASTMRSSGYADAEPGMWPTTDVWATASDGPYARAGVNSHTADEEPAPPTAFHMRPGQLVENASPLGAFSQPYQQSSSTRAQQTAPLRSARVVRENLS